MTGQQRRFDLPSVPQRAPLAAGDCRGIRGGEVAAAAIGDHLEVRLEFDDDLEESRVITITATGSRWAGRWDRVTTALEDFGC